MVTESGLEEKAGCASASLEWTEMTMQKYCTISTLRPCVNDGCIKFMVGVALNTPLLHFLKLLQNSFR